VSTECIAIDNQRNQIISSAKKIQEKLVYDYLKDHKKPVREPMHAKKTINKKTKWTG
jgi:hypothetical protein